MRKQSFFFRADGFLAHGRNAGVSTPASRRYARVKWRSKWNGSNPHAPVPQSPYA
jgi:hypothetical protein